MTLECKSCGRDKKVTEFPKDARKKHGVGSECKVCLAARARARRRGITCTRKWADSGWECDTCGKYKLLNKDNFYVSKGRLTEFDNICRECRNEYHKKQRRKDYDSEERRTKRETRSKVERQKHQDAKVQCIIYKGSVCNTCKIVYDGTNGMIFDFHHTDPSTKSFEILKKGKKTLEDQKDELNKCVLLCANCHRQEHSDEF